MVFKEFSGVSRLFQGISKDSFRIFQGSYKKIKGGFKHVSRKFKGCFKRIFRLFKESVKGVPICFFPLVLCTFFPPLGLILGLDNRLGLFLALSRVLNNVVKSMNV